MATTFTPTAGSLVLVESLQIFGTVVDYWRNGLWHVRENANGTVAAYAVADLTLVASAAEAEETRAWMAAGRW